MTVDFDRIRIANPAPQDTDLSDALMSTTALLAVIDERAGHMPVETQLQDNTQAEEVSPPRRGWMTAAIAFGVVLLVGAAIAMLSRRDQGIAPVDDVTATTEATQTTEAMSPEMETKIARAEEIIAIYNEGDLTAFNNLFQESAGYGNNAISVSAVQRSLGLRMALGDRRTGECVQYLASGDVLCDLTSVDDLGGPLGLSTSNEWIVELSDRGKITMIRTAEAIGPSNLATTMASWLMDAYPELMEQLRIGGNWYGDPERTGSVLLDLRDEFVAQSDQYSYTD